MNYLLLTTKTTQIRAEIYNTSTAKEILNFLPIESKVNRWGGEIYFTIPASVPIEKDSRDILEPGELGIIGLQVMPSVYSLALLLLLTEKNVEQHRMSMYLVKYLVICLHCGMLKMGVR